MQDLGKWIVIAGVFLTAFGFFVWGISRLGVPFGQMPGDISINKDKFSFYFPVVSSIVLSLLLTVIINAILYFFKKQ